MSTITETLEDIDISDIVSDEHLAKQEDQNRPYCGADGKVHDCRNGMGWIVGYQEHHCRFCGVKFCPFCTYMSDKVYEDLNLA